MSHNKPRRQRNNPVSGQKQNEGQDKSTNRHVYIEPGVQIDLVQDLRQKYDAAQQDSTSHSNKILFWTKISALLLFIYAGLTLWQGYSTKKAADAAKDAASAANESLKLSVLDERAWFGVSTAFLKIDRPARKGEMPPYVGEPLIIRVKFSNTGKTPALNVKIYTGGVIDPIERQPETGREVVIGPLAQLKPDDPNYQLAGNVPPGGDIYRDVPVWDNRALTEENKKALSIPTHRAFVFGKGTYTDVINPHGVHWFTFCYFLLPNEPVMGVYPHWNEIGDEKSQ
jgi:hypothetical protein